MRVAESGKKSGEEIALIEPSMGPQHESCGKLVEAVAAGREGRPFNGAAT